MGLSIYTKQASKQASHPGPSPASFELLVPCQLWKIFCSERKKGATATDLHLQIAGAVHSSNSNDSKMVAGARCIALKVDTLHSETLRYKSSLCRYNITSSIIRTGACNRRHVSVFAKHEANNRNGNCSSNYNGDALMESRQKVCEWQSSCAILNSQLQLRAEEVEAGAETKALVRSDSAGSDDSVSSKNVVPLPRPLSIADLTPPPKHGSQLRVAYQGVPGAYSEAAAGKAYPDCEAIPCDQFEAVFQAVELWVADRAVLPLENSLGGSIHRNYDLLLRHRLHIVGEVTLPVHHCLLALPGTRKEDLRRVISHPQALAQCEHTISKLFGPKVVREAVDDTAGAAQMVAENYLRDTAAIASSRAAEIYGMNIIADGIQDYASNVTRFAMLAREPIIPRVDRPFKTSIVFAHEEGTGILFKVLSAFAFRDISLTKIESRPQRNRPLRVVDDSNLGTAKYFEYLFYIDFEASMADPRAQNALTELQEFTNFLRVLGSYPMDMSPFINSHDSS